MDYLKCKYKNWLEENISLSHVFIFHIMKSTFLKVSNQ